MLCNVSLYLSFRDISRHNNNKNKKLNNRKGKENLYY